MNMERIERFSTGLNENPRKTLSERIDEIITLMPIDEHTLTGFNHCQLPDEIIIHIAKDYILGLNDEELKAKVQEANMNIIDKGLKQMLGDSNNNEDMIDKLLDMLKIDANGGELNPKEELSITKQSAFEVVKQAETLVDIQRLRERAIKTYEQTSQVIGESASQACLDEITVVIDARMKEIVDNGGE